MRFVNNDKNHDTIFAVWCYDIYICAKWFFMKGLNFYAVLLALFSFYGCSENAGSKQIDKRVITDLENRKVEITDDVKKIIGLNAGAMRYISYMGGIPYVVGVEDKEHVAKRPYNFAFPEIKQKAIIGPQPGGNEEQIMKANPDVIFWAGYATSKGSSEELQRKTGIPTLTIKSGELGVENEAIYNSIRVIGKVLKKESRAEELVAYMENNIKELEQRTKNIPEKEKPSVYVGGLSFNGSRGLTSTRANFAPFQMVGAKNIVENLNFDKTYTKPINIDIEQLIKWNPDYIFIDSDGWLLAKKEIEKDKAIYSALKAFKNNNVYIIPRYINNSTSYDYAFIDAWYVGKVLYPEKFKDIKIEEKATEILEKFYDKKINLNDFDLEFKQIDLN